MSPADAGAPSLASELLSLLGERAWSLGVAESLTGGLLAATIVSVPGASASFRGGVVAYATPIKHLLVGVDAALLARPGPVSAETAAVLAEGVRVAVTIDGDPATVGLATTGVAGPDRQEGHPVGTVFIACAGPDGTIVTELHLAGERDEIRVSCVNETLRLAVSTLSGMSE